MGKKNRKKDSERKKRRKNNKPTKFNEANSNNTVNDLETELNRLSEQRRINPSSAIKNREKRKELVIERNTLKNRLKGKLRRKKQKVREELGDDAIPVIETKSIDKLRDADFTYIENDDMELEETKKVDEFSDFYSGKTEPQILITTSISHTGSIYKFVKELKDCIPNSYFYYRKKFDIKEIIEQAKEKNFTDIIVVYERLKKPYRLVYTHLPDGPTYEFKISSVYYHDQIPNAASVETDNNPEIILKNFSTKVGFRVSRGIRALFPYNVNIKGRRVVTFHNQRDFIFFRQHRYIFNEELNGVTLQECGPRFTLRLLTIQHKTFDGEFGEYEWAYNDRMGVKRRKLYL
jgi:ribosome production factor 1